MKRYMVVYSIPEISYTWEGKTVVDPAFSGSHFYDSLSDASNAVQDICYGFGGRAQVYSWKEATEENDYDGDYYEFLYE